MALRDLHVRVNSDLYGVISDLARAHETSLAAAARDLLLSAIAYDPTSKSVTRPALGDDSGRKAGKTPTAGATGSAASEPVAAQATPEQSSVSALAAALLACVGHDLAPMRSTAPTEGTCPLAAALASALSPSSARPTSDETMAATAPQDDPSSMDDDIFYGYWFREERTIGSRDVIRGGWSPMEDEFLRRTSGTLSITDQATRLGRTRDSVRHRRTRIGVDGDKSTRTATSYWTKERDERLCDMVGEGKTYREVAEALGVSRAAARSRARRIGLRSPLAKGK